MSERIKATCAQCGKTFDMGWNGVSPNGVDYCDQCYGIQRGSSAGYGLASALRIVALVMAGGLIVYALVKFGMLVP
jgi:hypothetical protein